MGNNQPKPSVNRIPQFSGISFDGKHFPQPNQRVAVIGGGPSGIYMAYLLKKAGIVDITVFEKVSANSVLSVFLNCA